MRTKRWVPKYRYTVVRVVKRPRKDGAREVSEVWFKDPRKAEGYARRTAKRLKLKVHVSFERVWGPWQRRR